MLRHLKLKIEIKIKNNRLMIFCVDDKELLEKYKATWTKIENLRNIKLNTLQVYNDRDIKTRIRTNGDNVFTNFSGLNVPKDDK